MRSPEPQRLGGRPLLRRRNAGSMLTDFSTAKIVHNGVAVSRRFLWVARKSANCSGCRALATTRCPSSRTTSVTARSRPRELPVMSQPLDIINRNRLIEVALRASSGLFALGLFFQIRNYHDILLSFAALDWRIF